jgi:membrane protease YdiL (CAAX protease family)
MSESTTATAESGRPIRGFDTFLAVMTVLAVNIGVGLILGVVFVIVWTSAKLPGNPAILVQTDFYMVLGLTAVLNAITLVGLWFVGRRFAPKPFAYFFAPVPAATIAKAVASGFAVLVLFFSIEAALRYGWHIDLTAAKSEQAISPKSWSQLVVALGIGAAFIPFYEELLFRGFIFGWLKRVTPLWLAITITAAVFSLVHGLLLTRGGISGWVGTGEIFGLGLLLSWWVARTNSLWPALAVHFVNNATVFVVAFLLPNWP